MYVKKGEEWEEISGSEEETYIYVDVVVVEDRLASNRRQNLLRMGIFLIIMGLST